MNENEKVICPTCQEENESNDTYCRNCKTRLNYDSNYTTPTRKTYTRIEGERFITATKWIAILELICSCYMAIESWSKAGKINEYMYKNTEVAKQLKDSLEMSGVYFLLGGIILFVVLMAVHYIGKNVIDLRRDINNM